MFCAVLFLRNTWLPRLPYAVTPEALGLPARVVEFRATDGLRLSGWLMAAEPERPWVIMCHGLGANRADLLDIAAGLFRAGYNLFLFDFRGHGASGGRTTSFGWTEQRDLEGALAFLGSQPEIPPRPYGVYGISMGGAVALMVAARDERLGAVVVDSAYPNLAETMDHHVRLMYPWLPRQPFGWFVHATYRLRYGVWPEEVSPERAIGGLSPRPVLVFHGAEDPRMPVTGAQRLAEASGEPKELVVLSGAGHLGAFGMDPRGYIERMAQVFRLALVGSKAG